MFKHDPYLYDTVRTEQSTRARQAEFAAHVQAELRRRRSARRRSPIVRSPSIEAGGER